MHKKECIAWLIRAFVKDYRCEPTRVMCGRLERCNVLNTQQMAGIMMIISTVLY